MTEKKKATEIDGEDIWGENHALPAEPQETEAEALYTIKHNGEDIALTLEELIARAQMGTDYERIRADRDSMKNAPVMQLLARLKKQTGLSEQGLLRFFESTAKEAMVQNAEDELVKVGYEPETARRIAEAEFEKNYGRCESAASGEKKNEELIAEFARLFPDVTELPAEVCAKMERGENPIIAYQSYLLREKENELANLKTAAKNKQSYAGSVKGGARPDDELARILMEG